MKKDNAVYTQKQKFIEAVKEHQCSENQKDFDNKLQKISPKKSEKSN